MPTSEDAFRAILHPMAPRSFCHCVEFLPLCGAFATVWSFCHFVGFAHGEQACQLPACVAHARAHTHVHARTHVCRTHTNTTQTHTRARKTKNQTTYCVQSTLPTLAWGARTHARACAHAQMYAAHEYIHVRPHNHEPDDILRAINPSNTCIGGRAHARTCAHAHMHAHTTTNQKTFACIQPPTHSCRWRYRCWPPIGSGGCGRGVWRR